MCFQCFYYNTYIFERFLLILRSAGLGGPRKMDVLTDDNGQSVGLRLVLLKVTEHDKGVYYCEVKNQFGKMRKYIQLSAKMRI